MRLALTQNDGKLTATANSPKPPENERTPAFAGLLPIAGARFVSRYHPQIIERGRLAD
jgi:hypothetical protein